MIRKLGLITLFVAGLLYFSGCGPSQDTVATVGSSKITKKDFKEFLKKRFPGRTSFASVDSSTKRRILDQLIQEELKVNAAYDMGLDKDEEFISQMHLQEGSILGNKYFERVIVDKLFPEDVVRANFEKQKDEVKASHILIGYKGSQGSKATRSKAEALSLAENIAKQAKNGADFAQLALKYSEDPSVKRNKGDMGYFTWGRMVEAFQEAAFKMKPGEISDPVETPYGFHIIKVEDRRPNPKFNENQYEAQKLPIKKRLYFTMKDSAVSMWRHHMEALKKKHELTFLDDNLKKVVEISKEKKKGGDITPDSFSDEDKAIVLAKWDEGKVTLNDLFLFYYGKRFNYLLRALGNVEQLKRETDNVAFQDIIIYEARRMGIDKDPEVKSRLDEARRRQLAIMAYQKAVTEKANPSDADIRKYYEEHTKEFTQPAQIEIWEIYLKDKKTADKVARLAKAGRNFERLAVKYSKDAMTKKKKGYIGYRARNRRGAVSQKAFEVGENKVAGPVKYRNGWVVLKTGKKKPEVVRSFEKSYQQAKTRARNAMIKSLRDKWEKELREKYQVTINQKALESV